MLTSLWEGTNGDRNTGSYEVFYQPEQVPNPGWNEVMVNTKGFRYLRWRQTTGNGTIRELEWYRSNVKLTGPFFGTPGSWQNDPNATWDKAVDGNTATGFNGPDVNQPGLDQRVRRHRHQTRSVHPYRQQRHWQRVL